MRFFSSEHEISLCLIFPIDFIKLNFRFFYVLRGRKLNSHLERAIQKAMTELDKQSNASKGNSEKKPVASSHKSPKTKLVKIAPAPDKK
jgi:hypothetical protein